MVQIRSLPQPRTTTVPPHGAALKRAGLGDVNLALGLVSWQGSW